MFGLLVLAFAWFTKKDEAAQVGMGIFVLSALAAVAVYLTGEAAEEVVEGLPGISHAIIEQHKEAALFALVAAVLLGTVSLAGLWISRRGMPRWLTTTTLVLALVTTGFMAWTANLGGQISHPEIRSSATTASVDADVSVDAEAEGEAYEHDD